MVELSRDQIVLLASIGSGSLENCSELTDDEKYLLSHNLICPLHRTYTAEERAEHKQMGILVVGPGPVVGYEISPRGKGVLYLRQTDNKRFWLGFWVNFALAVIAIVISIIALIC